MMKVLQMLSALFTTLPLKLYEVAKDKIVTVDELPGVIEAILKSLNVDQKTVVTIGSKEVTVIRSILNQILDAMADRVITVGEIKDIVEISLKESGIGQIKILSLK